MAEFHLSRLAVADLQSISDYTQDTWGEAQALRYIADLRDCCARIAHSPMLGRSCDQVQPGYRRMEQGKHVIFYRQKGAGIFISRILHQSMLPHNHFLEGPNK